MSTFAHVQSVFINKLHVRVSASHLYLTQLWDGDTVFLVLHCLFIAYAAGASLLPVVTFALDTNAAAVVDTLPSDVIEAIQKVHNSEIDSNATTTESYDIIYELESQTTRSTVSPLARNVTFTLFQPLVALLPFLLAITLLSLTLYTCIKNCQNRFRHYRYKTKYKQYQILKEKVAQSLKNRKVFPKLNGKPAGENGTVASGKTGQNGKNKLKTADHTEDAESGAEENESVIINGDLNNKNTNNSNYDIQQSTMESSQYDVTDKTKRKMKVLTFELANTAGEKPKRQHRKAPWLLDNQPCSIQTLLHLYVFFTLAAAIETILSYSLYSYAIYSPVELSTSRAVLLLTVYLVAIVLSRMTALIGANVFPPNAFVLCLLVLSAISAGVLVLYGGRLTTVNWLFTALLGICIGPIIPGGFTWANVYLNFNWKSISLAYWLISIGMTLFGPFGAALFEYNGYKAVLWLVLALTTTSVVLFAPTLSALQSHKVLQMPKNQNIDPVFEQSKHTYV